MIDSRQGIRQIADLETPESGKVGLIRFAIALVVALLAAYLPAYTGLEDAGRTTLFILLFAAGLWLSVAIPAFAVSFLVIALEIVLLGFFDVETWDYYLLPWSSPLVFLFLAGFFMAVAASKTRLDIWIAELFAETTLSALILIPLFAYIVVVLSNFMSNTAAANILLPLVAAVAVVLGDASPVMAVVTVALSASLAMALPVSTPPNAIVFASGALQSRDFWFIGMLSGVVGPLVILGWIYLVSVLF